MNRQTLMVGAAVVVLGTLGVQRLEKRIDGLEIKQVSTPGENAKAISTQEFYPIFSQSQPTQESRKKEPLGDAFYTPPPEPKKKVNYVEIPEPEPKKKVNYVEIPEPEPKKKVNYVEIPEPEPDPINFLEEHARLFSLQATFSEQNAAIINGVSYFQGEYLQGALPVMTPIAEGEKRRENLRIRLTRVTGSSVTLAADHSKEWPQHLTIELNNG